MILVDTAPIVAVVNDRDNHHQERKYLLERLPGPLLIPTTSHSASSLRAGLS